MWDQALQKSRPAFPEYDRSCVRYALECSYRKQRPQESSQAEFRTILHLHGSLSQLHNLDLRGRPLGNGQGAWIVRWPYGGVSRSWRALEPDEPACPQVL